MCTLKKLDVILKILAGYTKTKQDSRQSSKLEILLKGQ